MLDILDLAQAAKKRIGPHIRQTPLEPSIDLSRKINGRVFLKLESNQHTGSFKVRGALNRLLALTADEKRVGSPHLQATMAWLSLLA